MRSSGSIAGSLDHVLGLLCVRNTIAVLSLPASGACGPLEVPVRLLDFGCAGLLVDQPCVGGEAVPVPEGAAVTLSVPMPSGGGRQCWSARVAGRVGFRASPLSGLALEEVEPVS